MKRILFLATTLCVMMSCQQKPKTAAIDMSDLDLSTAPGVDFFQYATGGWQAKNPLKPEYARYGSFDMLRENNETRINNLFSEMAKTTAEKGSVNQKIADLYKMGLDSVRRNNESAEPVKSDIAEILSLQGRDQIARELAKQHEQVGAPFFGTDVMSDLKNSNMNVLYVSQAGLGIGDRDYYIDPANDAIKEGYKEYLKKAFDLVGFDKETVDKAIAATLKIETAIAEKSRSNVELRDMEAAYNPMSKADFMARYDAIDWDAYFNALSLPAFDRLIVCQPEMIDAVNEIFKTYPVEDIRYYLAAQYLNGASAYLSDDFYAATFDFFGRKMTGTQEMKPRWKRAMGVPNAILGEAVGQIYVQKFFPEKDKERMLTLVENLQIALGQHIDKLDWMGDSTKMRAHEKLASFTVKIGYPDKWKDYSTLTIDPEMTYWANIKQANKWHTQDGLQKLGKPVDRDEWHMSPQTVNAYYNPTTNEICFPAAILQPPFYNSEADDAVNYGAIGVVIGHEMTHGFDDQGRQFDKDGNMNNWWTEADEVAFKAKTDVLVNQFNAIEVLPAKEVQPAIFANGSLSLGENIADQGGLRVAYTALQNSFADKQPADIDDLTAAQRFYIAYAGLWAQNIRDEEIARLTKLDVHSLGKWRVNATLRNIQSFYDAFGVTDGEMFMPENERVVIW